jgi:hypothetical protein
MPAAGATLPGLLQDLHDPLPPQPSADLDQVELDALAFAEGELADHLQIVPMHHDVSVDAVDAAEAVALLLPEDGADPLDTTDQLSPHDPVTLSWDSCLGSRRITLSPLFASAKIRQSRT